MWQSTRGKWWLTHWASLLRWIWSISEYPKGIPRRSMKNVKWYSSSQVRPQNMCLTHSWPQQVAYAVSTRVCKNDILYMLKLCWLSTYTELFQIPLEKLWKFWKSNFKRSLDIYPMKNPLYTRSGNNGLTYLKPEWAPLGLVIWVKLAFLPEIFAFRECLLTIFVTLKQTS